MVASCALQNPELVSLPFWPQRKPTDLDLPPLSTFLSLIGLSSPFSFRFQFPGYLPSPLLNSSGILVSPLLVKAAFSPWLFPLSLFGLARCLWATEAPCRFFFARHRLISRFGLC